MREVSEAAIEAGGRDILKCYQCGTCTAVCPWGLTASLRVREMMHLLQIGLEGFESDDLWRCVTCHACVERCPRGVGIAEVFESVRSLLVAAGTYPKPLAAAVGSLSAAGNPWQGDPGLRRDWAADLDVEKFDQKKHDILLFVCCTPAYDPRTKGMARAAMKLLRAAGVRVGLLPMEHETCCGDLAVRVGAKDLFESLRGRLGPRLQTGPARVVVLSPHCRETFRKSYEPEVNAIHIVELLDELLQAGRLKLKKPLEARVTYHDPCYLGRRGEVFEAPRHLLKAVPGLELVEMDRNRNRSICCGGGGGGSFGETAKEERLANLRLDQALAANAGILATACPFCVLMFQDAVTVRGVEEKIKVMDVSEILAEVIS